MAGDGYIERVSQLIDLLREKHVVRFNGHIPWDESTFLSTELVLAPPPAKQPKKGEIDPLKARREHYELQLGRPVSDRELELLP